jgi:hypothetical protein
MAREELVVSHWFHLIEDLQASPLEFYVLVGGAVERRQIPDCGQSRVEWREGGPLSAKREYLRVKRKEYTFDICGAPFGTGFFVSWWLTEPLGCLGRFFRHRKTYYRVDTALMFQEAVHAAVLEVIDGMTSAKGIRALSELERKPILRSLVQ